MLIRCVMMCLRVLRGKEINMSSSVFTVLEKNYLKTGLAQLRSSVQRSIAKEPNPEIVRLKNEDIKAIDSLEAKIGVM